MEDSKTQMLWNDNRQTVMKKQKTQTVMKYQKAPFSLPLPTVFAFHKICYVFLTPRTNVHNE